MSIFETLAQKPWLPSQEKKDNLHTGKSFEFDSSRVALICFLGSITALFSLFFVAYVGRMAYGDWRILPEPPLLWINTAVLIISSFLFQKAKNLSNKFMAERVVNFGVDVFRQAEKTLLLQVLDQGWKDHLLMLDQMRQSIGLRAYAQKDPLNEYKRESFELFEEMLDKLRKTITSVLSYIEIKQEETVEKNDYRDPIEVPNKKIPRNTICPLCDSGKKYKHCCGRY